MTLTLPDGRDVRPGKILCIGRNYAAHVAEMGDVSEAEPVVFLKPTTALVADGGEMVLPRQSDDVHHELELVVVIGHGRTAHRRGRRAGPVAAYALGLDLTARDLQAEAKSKKGPWSIAKGFDTFAPLGPLTDAAEIADPQALEIALAINGDERQRGTTDHMVFSVARIVSFLSSVFTLEPGDLIYTGTPEGVGPVHAGDRLEATGTGLAPLAVTVRRESWSATRVAQRPLPGGRCAVPLPPVPRLLWLSSCSCPRPKRRPSSRARHRRRDGRGASRGDGPASAPAEGRSPTAPASSESRSRSGPTPSSSGSSATSRPRAPCPPAGGSTSRWRRRSRHQERPS